MTHNFDRPRPSLPEILSDMVAQANANPMQPARRRLSRGLHVEIVLEAGHYHVKLMRDRVLPSRHEWNAILAAWPWFARTEPTAETVNVINPYLHGRIPASRNVQLKFC